MKKSQIQGIMLCINLKDGGSFMYRKYQKLFHCFMIFIFLTTFQVNDIFSAISFFRGGSVPTTKPTTSQQKRERLIQTSTKDWKGKNQKKNVIIFSIPGDTDWDTLWIKLGKKRDTTFKKILVKQKIKNVNSYTEMSRVENITISVDEWIRLQKNKTGSIQTPNNSQTLMIKVVLVTAKINGKYKKPHIQEIRLEMDQSIIYNNQDHVLMVGSPNYQATVLEEGKVDLFVIPGNQSLDLNTVMTASVTGTVQESNLGYFVRPIGDMNEDGYRDFFIGATGEAGSSKGSIHIIFGGNYDPQNANGDQPGAGSTPLLNGSSRLSVTGTPGSRFGASAVSIYNFDGNRKNHLVIGAPSDAAGGNDRGLVEIFPSSSNQLIIGGSDFTVVATQDFTFIGESSASGDWNGDGYGDLGLGAATANGQVWIYLGKNNQSVTQADWLLTGSSNSGFGSSLDWIDINGDGYDDLAIASPNVNTNTGKVEIFLGGQTLDQSVDLTIDGLSINQYFGKTIANVGDVDGDGYADLAIAAPGSDSKNGTVYLYFGGSNFPNDRMTFNGAGSECLGVFIYPMGDIDQNGMDSFFVGAPCDASDQGKGYVIRGTTNRSSITKTTGTLFQGTQAGSSFGDDQLKAGTI